MTIALVQISTASGSSVTLGSNPTSGNKGIYTGIYILSSSTGPNLTVTDTQGNTFTCPSLSGTSAWDQNGTVHTEGQMCSFGASTADTANYTPPGGASSYVCFFAEYSGLSTTLDAIATGGQTGNKCTTANPLPAAGLTATGSDLAFNGMFAQTGFSAATSFVQESSNSNSAIFDRIITNGTTVSAQNVSGSPNTDSGWLLLIKAAGGTSNSRSISESITGPSDSVARAFVGTRGVSESVSMSDAVARHFVGARSVSESATGPSDALTRAQVLARLVAESIPAISDALSRHAMNARTITELVTMTDAIVRQVIGARLIAESLTGPSDAPARLTVVSRAVPESATGPSDALTRAQVLGRIISESVTDPSDAVARGGGFHRSVSESIISPSDSVTHGNTHAASISESITGPSDVVARAFVGARAIAESLTGPSDSPSRLGTFARSLAESLTSPSDAVARIAAHVRTIAESATGPTDAAARATVAARSVNESIGAPADSPSRQGVVARIITEAIGAPSDSLARALHAARAFVESVTSPSDSVAAVVTRSSIPESIPTPGDAVTRGGVFDRIIAEAIGAISDLVTAIVQSGRQARCALVVEPSLALNMTASPSLAITILLEAPLMGPIVAGNSVTLTAEISDLTGQPYDPDHITATHYDPVTHAVESLSVTHLAAGSYQANALLATPGMHIVRFAGDTRFPFVSQITIRALDPVF
jgi:hypothetical protein